VGDGGVRSLQSARIFLRFVLENSQVHLVQSVIIMAFPFVELVSTTSHTTNSQAIAPL